jgi:hypothetical protein
MLLMLKFANKAHLTNIELIEDMESIGFASEIIDMVTQSWGGVVKLESI